MKELLHLDSVSLDSIDQAGAQIYAQLKWPACVYLRGEMGAGKTTLCQSMIAAAGYPDAVTSPTYNIIQEYPVKLGSKSGTIYHMDLYRLEDPLELEFLGIEDLWNSQTMFLIEWPERAKGLLRNADYTVDIAVKKPISKEVRELILRQTF